MKHRAKKTGPTPPLVEVNGRREEQRRPLTAEERWFVRYLLLLAALIMFVGIMSEIVMDQY